MPTLPRRAVAGAAFLVLALTTAQAEIRTETVDYQVDGEPYTGYIAWDDAIEGERPGVLVVHEWWGHDEYARGRAEQLAELGYTGFALDMYGSGKKADHPDTAKQFMQAALSDMAAAERRFRVAMNRLQDHPSVDPRRIAAQGYCFGGGVVLAMARRGVDLDGVVSFHGSLGTGEPAGKGDIKAAIQVYTGGADPFVPAEQVGAFVEEMQKAGARFDVVSYPGVQHSFTSPQADEYAERFGLPTQYDARADRDSWAGMKAFYRDIFSGAR